MILMLHPTYRIMPTLLLAGRLRLFVGIDASVVLLPENVPVGTVQLSLEFSPFSRSNLAVRLRLRFVCFDFSLLDLKPSRFTGGQFTTFHPLLDAFLLVLFPLVDAGSFVLRRNSQYPRREHKSNSNNC